MKPIIYITSSGEAMSKDNLMDYLKSFYIINPEYKDWGFDEITGGPGEFISSIDYDEMKRYFYVVNKREL